MDATKPEAEMARGMSDEWRYRFQERLAILCEDRRATLPQLFMAKTEADEADYKLNP